jgi:subtilase family serine protease
MQWLNPRSARKAHKQNARPQLEVLEDRLAPSATPPLILTSPTFAPTLKILHHSIHKLTGAGPAGGYTPAQMRHAYGFDQISFQSNGQTVAADGAGQTVAIVDAYDDPSIASDLSTFDGQFGLADPSSFVKVGIDANGNGSTTRFPSVDPGWAGEIELDVEWVHAMAPKANIVLVEAYAATLSDLVNAINYARAYNGVSAVTMSWGGGEFFGEQQYDTSFTAPAGHTPETFFASSGDSGAGTIWPSVSSHVVATGGTTLNADQSGNYQGESGWNGSGGGISAFVAAPSYQNNLAIYSGDPSAGGMRAVPDVAYDSDPNSGVSAYGIVGFGGWVEVGGTSAASPQWAALTAITNQGLVLSGQSTLDGYTQTLPDLYKLSSSDFHDITTGSNGYPAGSGFDLVTGLGSPLANKVIADLGAPAAPQVLTSVSISPANPAVGDGGQLQFSAIGYDQFGHAMNPQPTVSWSIVSGLGGITSAGLYSAPASGAGASKVGVTAAENGVSVSSSTNVTYAPGPAISGLAANPNPVTGTGAGLSAQVADPNAGSLTYTWSEVSGPAGAPAVAFTPPTGSTAPGAVSANAAFGAAGSYVLELSVTDGLGLSASSTVGVAVSQAFTSVVVSPTSVGVQDGGQAQFSAVADDQFGAPLSVQPTFGWAVVGLGAISSTGVYTAPATGSGTDTVQATATVNGFTATGSAAANYSIGLSILSLNANPNPVTSSTTTLTAQLYDVNPMTPVNFAWSVVSSPAGAMPPSFYPQSGMLLGMLNISSTATFFAPGAYVLQLSANDNDGRTTSATLNLNVETPALTINSIAANPSPVTGSTTTLSAQIADAGTASINYNWMLQSSPPGVPTPSISPSSGLILGSGAVSSSVIFFGVGTYQFQLNASDNMGQSASSTVTVSVVSTLTTITLSPSTAAVNAGGTQPFSAVAYDQFSAPLSPQPAFSWSVAFGPGSVDPTGVYTAPTSGSGSATVQASATVNGVIVSGSASITILDGPTISSVGASPAPVTGTTTTLSVTASDPSPGALAYAWSVASAPSGAPTPNIANFTAASTLATFYQAGNYTFRIQVTNTLTGLSTNTTVAVTVVQTLTTVSVSPGSATVHRGGYLGFSATAYDQFHKVMAKKPAFTWSVNGVGSINQSGVYFAGYHTGFATIKVKAVLNGVTVTSTATVMVT